MRIKRSFHTCTRGLALALCSGWLSLTALGQNVTYTGGPGGYTFSKRFKTIKDIPRFSEWDSLPDGKWLQLYASGDVAVEYIMKNHLLNGPAVAYYPGGGKRFEFTMYGNYIHGEFREFYPAGQLQRLYHYNEGFLNGEWFIYYEDGQMQAKGQCRDDKQVGKLYHWWPNGKMKEERTYKNDTLNGITIYWYEHGPKKMEGNQLGVDNKVGHWTYWFEDGQKHKECEYRNGMELIWNAWDRRGKPLVVDGNGKYIYYTLTGKKLIEGAYLNGMQEGRWFFWDEKNPDATPRQVYYKEGVQQ